MTATLSEKHLKEIRDELKKLNKTMTKINMNLVYGSKEENHKMANIPEGGTRIFISTPMNGKSKEEIMSRIDYLSDKIHSQISTYSIPVWGFQENVYGGNPIAALAEGVRRLSYCDAILLDTGWEDARGCRIEKAVAEEYGLNKYYFYDKYIYAMNDVDETSEAQND